MESLAPLVFRGSLTTPAPAALRDGLAVRHDDLIDVEETVSLQADVHERRLHPGQDVVDLALVDVADDRAAAAALDVELCDLPFIGWGSLLGALALVGAALRLEHGDARFTAIDADEDVLLHVVPFCASADEYAAEPPSWAGLIGRGVVWVCSSWLSATVG
jgi:hypothetical protein